MNKKSKSITITNCVLVLAAIFLILSPIYFPLLVVDATVAIGSTTQTIYAIADSYVNASSPDTNYGLDSLKLSSAPDSTCAYMMFDLSSLPPGANVLSCTLYVYLSAISGYTGSIGVHYCSNDDWTELGITWNNKPTYSATATDTNSYGMIVSYRVWNGWDVTFDVQNALAKGKISEVLVDNRVSSSANFNSREEGNRPHIDVEYSMEPVYSVHVDSAQDTGVTNDLGFITVANNMFSLPKDIDVVSGDYQIAYSGGYMFNRWETSGGVTVSNADAAATTVTVSGDGGLRAVGDVTRLEYSYDYEQAGSESQDPGYIDAVRFSPLFSDKLLIARFYMYYVSSFSSNTFMVHVMDENRNDIIVPFEQTPTSTGWFDVDLSSYNITVNPGTDFYIGMEWINTYPRLGEDSSSNFDRSWYWNGTEVHQETYGDFMIRAVTGLTYSLTISTTAGGSTTPASGSYIYSAGTGVSVLAIATAGYIFDHWELDGIYIGSANPYTIAMNANHSLQGLFTVLPATPTPAPTTTPTPVPTSTPVPTPTPVATSTPSPAQTATPTISPSPSASHLVSPSPSQVLTPSPQLTATPSPSANPSSNPQFALSAETAYILAIVAIVVPLAVLGLVIVLKKRVK